MPNFWGCRCCNRVLLVLASNGKINFVSGRGTDLGQIDDALIESSGEVRWLKKNAWVYSQGMWYTSPQIHYGDRSAITLSNNGWYAGFGLNQSFQHNFLAVGAAGEHIFTPATQSGGTDVPAKIFDDAGTFSADCNYDNGGNPGGGSPDPYEMVAGYVNGKYTISTMEPLSPAWVTYQHVFNPDGSLDTSWDYNTVFSLSSATFTSAVYALPVSDGLVGGYVNASSISKLSKVDLTGSIVWTRGTLSGLINHNRIVLLPDGNFVIWGSQAVTDPFHLIDTTNGNLIDSFTVPSGLSGIVCMCADPTDPDILYAFTGSSDLVKYRISTDSLLWSRGFTGYSVYSMDSIKM